MSDQTTDRIGVDTTMVGGVIKRVMSIDGALYGAGLVYSKERLVSDASLFKISIQDGVPTMERRYSVCGPYSDTFTAVVGGGNGDTIVGAGWGNVHLTDSGFVAMIDREFNSTDVDLFIEPGCRILDIIPLGENYLAVGVTTKGEGLILELDAKLKVDRKQLLTLDGFTRIEIMRVVKSTPEYGVRLFLGMVLTGEDGTITGVVSELNYENLVDELIMAPDDDFHLSDMTIRDNLLVAVGLTTDSEGRQAVGVVSFDISHEELSVNSQMLVGSGGPINGNVTCAISPDFDAVISVFSKEGTAVVSLDPFKGTTIKQTGHMESKVYDIQFDPDGRLIAVGRRDDIESVPMVMRVDSLTDL